MPAKKVIQKEAIINGALNMIREEGIESINARSLAKYLNCSTQPIYNSFKNMDELKQTLLDETAKIYYKELENTIKENKYPEYKAAGMGYIIFAQKEPNLFKFLYLRERDKNKQNPDNDKSYQSIIQMIMKNYNLDEKMANIFHLSMWIYVHGIATQIATGYVNWDLDIISKLLTINFKSTISYFSRKDEEEIWMQ